jgi:Xaa-Pro aminopeptidase
MTALTRASLAQDVERRVRVLQSLMKARDLTAVLALATGAPSQTGWLRYYTAAELWEHHAFVVIERDHSEPLVVVESDDLAEGIRRMATTTRVESTFARRVLPIHRVIDVIADLTGGRGRVGVLGLDAQLPLWRYQAFRSALPAIELVDITDEGNRRRMIKSPVEIAAMREMGHLLNEGLDLFATRARPGLSLSEVAGEIEGFLRGRGCFWGTSKYSLDERPYLFPASPESRFAAADVILYEFVYSGPLGYWHILSSLYSFRPLPADTAHRLRATLDAIRETARIAVPGATCGAIAGASDRAFKEHGFTIVGRHTVDCHPIGLDINDGPRDIPPDWQLEENMTLAVHPASLLAGDLGFFLCDIFLVQHGGAVPLSPRTSFYELLS